MLILLFMHVVQLILYFYIDDPDVFDFIKMVDFDYEANLPALFALLAALTQKAGQASWRHWLAFSLIFVFLAFDEGAAIHEEVGDFTENFIKAEDYLYFPWIISYGVVTLILVLISARFLLRLPSATRLGFVIAGCLFVGGAVGIEMISAKEADTNGTSTPLYSLLYTIEEVLEMSGVIMLIHVLLAHLKRQWGQVLAGFDTDDKTNPQE